MARGRTVASCCSTTRRRDGFWRRVSTPLRCLRDLRGRIRLENTLSSLPDHQLFDLGLSRGEISAYARAVPQAERRLGRMLRRQEIASEFVEPGSPARSTLLKTCRTCPNILACDRWLQTGRPADGYRAFCPNVKQFDALPRRPGPLPQHLRNRSA